MSDGAKLIQDDVDALVAELARSEEEYAAGAVDAPVAYDGGEYAGPGTE